MSTFERIQRQEKVRLSRQERLELERRLNSDDPGLTVIHANCAGIDIGGESHFVAVPPDRAPDCVREFGCWTAQLDEIAAWLKQCRITHVAMQATGVYWLALEAKLREAGLDVAVVNAKGTKNLPGRKSDVQECEWIRKLHAYGLLRRSFRPAVEIEKVQTVWRCRERVVKEAARAVQHMQKALTKMNVQLTNAISDISGLTGMRIIRAIVKGEFDPKKLVELCDWRIHASREEVEHSLQGNFADHLVWELKLALNEYDFHRQELQECDKQLKRYMGALSARPAPGERRRTAVEMTAKQVKRMRAKREVKAKNEPGFDLKAELIRVTGVDLTTIDGISTMTAQTFVSEIGPNLKDIPNEKAFCCLLQLVPMRDVSGGRVIRHLRIAVLNRLGNALKMAAQSLWHSDSYLGAKYRHLKARLGALKANKAMARYLACLIYRMMTKGEAWVDRGAAYYEGKQKERALKALERKAANLGMKVVAA